MKSTFKKALAAVSAAAVVATSAAVFTAIPADAIGSLAIAGVTVTMDELQANNYLVTVPVTINGNTDGWDALAFGVSWNTSEITYSSNSRGGLLGDPNATFSPVNLKSIGNIAITAKKNPPNHVNVEIIDVK